METLKHTNREPSALKFRLIVARPSSPTRRLYNFEDIILKPIFKHVPNFIRDDLDFLNHLTAVMEDEAIFVSFDVVSLYTSRPHDHGLEAIEQEQLSRNLFIITH